MHWSTHNALYFPQTALHQLIQQHGKLTALEFLNSTDGTDLTETQARNHLGEVGLAKNLALSRVATLSAGQRVRLWLAQQLLQHPKPSLLVFDEVTENVDVETRQSLVELLTSFDGAVLVISHDSDFGDRTCFTKTCSCGDMVWRLSFQTTNPARNPRYEKDPSEPAFCRCPGRRDMLVFISCSSTRPMPSEH